MAFFFTSYIARDAICTCYGKDDITRLRNIFKIMLSNIIRNTVHVRYMHFTNYAHVDLKFI